ncbi:MAG: sigma-70 family RNA polymerase sigma factor [Betaproteobacteria bacterium]|nr:sigma-70 family RNA polymerase sigma factor [Betaproteobacteria bacterium]
MPPATDIRAQIEALRPYLLRFASLQLRDAAAAEDAVQEALLAALAGEASFAGRANLRTWLTGILKHKIVDAIRRQAREPLLPQESEDAPDDFDALFERNGHWSERPARWGNPDGALEQAQFFRALEACLERLPARTAQAFMLREHLGLETSEICKELEITPTHCWVMLYRARMTLRDCLQQTWFGK